MNVKPIDRLLHRKLQQFVVKNLGIINGEKARHFLACQTKAKIDAPGVALMSNGVDSQYMMLMHCKNLWYCPICEPTEMNKWAERIKCAVDALKEWHNLVPIMITFTVPHISIMPLSVTHKILNQSYQEFLRNCTSRTKKQVITNWSREYGVKYHMRVTEITKTRHGWNVHNHSLFWIPRHKLDNQEAFLEWERKLHDAWLSITKNMTKRYWRRVDGTTPSVAIERLYKYMKWDEEGLYISKRDGYIAEMHHSDYLCGWGCDNELTGLRYKPTKHTDSMTIQQLMYKALLENDTKCQKYLLEYMTYFINCKLKRVSPSHYLHSIITKWKQSEKYQQYLLSKNSQTTERRWRLIAWFSKPLWYELISAEFNTGLPIRNLFLYWATKPDGFERIDGFMKLLGLAAPEKDCPLKRWCENICNNVKMTEITSDGDDTIYSLIG